MLQIEQWWSLSQTQFRSRDAFNRWRPRVILGHLSDSLLLQTLTTPSNTEPKPQQKLVSIQEFIGKGTRTKHTEKLRPLLERLRFLQVNAPPETARLIQDYHSAIESYLEVKPIRLRVFRDNTINQLNLLDTILKDLITESKTDHTRAKQATPTAQPD